jgi:hypothetical protein
MPGRLRGWWVLAAVFAVSCSSGAGVPGGPDASGATTAADGSLAVDASGEASPTPSTGIDAADGFLATTFHKDVEPILQRSCQRCHFSGGIAPFPLMTYLDAKMEAADMVLQTSLGNMPPWGAVATPDCTPRFGWQEDVELPSADIATIAAWHQGGDLEGDPRDAPPPRAPAPGSLQSPSMTLKPPAAFSITSPTLDQFRCFVIDPKLSATQYVDGTFVIPGNATIVHHALVFADTKGASKALVTDPVTQSYDCFGGPGFANTSLLAAWAPGGVPVDYPPDSGARLDPGTLLVMQIHYHPHSATAMLGPDQTTFQMRFTASVPTHAAATYLIGNFSTPVKNGSGLLPGPGDPPSGPEFVIPPNVKGLTKTMQFTMPLLLPTQHIVAIGGHEHYVGTAVDITIERVKPTATQPATECLLSIPRWDFNWQRAYFYSAPFDQMPTAAPGDVLKIKCTYDNTLGNPKVVQSLIDQGLSAPGTVRLGETTLDEMCLGAFLVAN